MDLVLVMILKGTGSNNNSIYFNAKNNSFDPVPVTQYRWIKIRESNMVVIIVIFPKNENLGLKIKILKFLGIQPSYKRMRTQPYYFL